MEHHQSSVEKFEKFIWKVENFSHLKSYVIYSEPFVLGGYPWRIILYPKGEVEAEESLSIYLEAVKTDNMSEGWSRDVKYKFHIFNQFDANMTTTKESMIEFKAYDDQWGCSSFMPLVDKLLDLKKGFIVNDVCMVGVEIFVRKSTQEKQVNRSVTLTFESLAGPIEVETLVPKIEDPCPNLKTLSPDCHEPTIDPDTELFTALGRVLYFLKTRKVKDMNEKTCKELQVLWDELKKFKFDLTWLEPQVQSALGIHRVLEKAMEVEKMKENVVVLELETEKLKTKLSAAEVNLEVERDLWKAKGIKEIDFDSELGP
ncbi:MATH domain and coiled-coil domain-containing protein At3g58360-like [Vicia villosa]|uniref:MATH domain and coiled-coil domain-containing protein At3g58360-like n=1 Tax=Vicia villosa TaxID=3911 RepID=UPI00273C28D3|nr:MATH domain and coiled-coil domain-containing protein At3g58360-like [Vicia villosa]